MWDYRSGRTVHIGQHNYEIDSLCYFIRLSYHFWKVTGVNRHLTTKWRETIRVIIDLWKTEQRHETESCYRYAELSNEGKGRKTCYTGMTWG